MTAHQHETVELAFRGRERVPVGGAAPVTVRFRHADGEEVVVPGFWDEDATYLVRFLPGRSGAWTWWIDEELTPMEPRRGDVAVGPARTAGAVRVAHRHHFAHADGTPFRPVGGTAYNVLHQRHELRADTVASAAAAGFNKLRFMVFPQAGDSVEVFPDLMPFEKTDGAWDVSRPVPAFFRRLDAFVRDLDEAGIQADVLLLNAYDRGVFGLDGLSEAEDAVYLRYVIARLAASPNVWWSLCNEYDQLERPEERWDRAGLLVMAADPFDHPRSIHNWVHLFDHHRPWVTHASIQNGSAVEEPGRARLYRDAYDKPIVLDEIKYEGDAPARWGRLSARELVHRFWIATLEGCYASHGESFVLPGGSLHIVEGGALRGESPARLGFLRRILDALVVPGLDPVDKWDDPEHVAGGAPDQYVRYFGRSAPANWRVRLPIDHAGASVRMGERYVVDIIDTWNMTVTRHGTVTIDEVLRDEAFAGEALLPLPAGEAIAVRITREALAG
ncbi:DUF4038 domain-containing protein [Microbacterium excoecariae]|uniref:apiosidase-like domain-containing protein n=1 Tax=Microbacterium excoecariae TaxID=2715210 RepID=UPI001409BA48